jgi:hypothetical protein
VTEGYIVIKSRDFFSVTEENIQSRWRDRDLIRRFKYALFAFKAPFLLAAFIISSRWVPMLHSPILRAAARLLGMLGCFVYSDKGRVAV